MASEQNQITAAATRRTEPVHLGPEPTVEEELAVARAAARESEEELNQAVAELGRSIREPLSLTRQVRTNPNAWLAGAFVVGVLLGQLSRKR